MATTKVTFTLDSATIDQLETASEFLSLSKSEVVREAIQEFSGRLGRLTNRERLRMLRVFDEVIPGVGGHSSAAVDREIAEIKAARRVGGRRTRMEKRS
jgi:hypothetical protein